MGLRPILFIIAVLILVKLLVSLAGFPSPSLNAPPSTFVYPLLGTRISSDYGMRKHPIRHVRRHHGGVDLAAPVGAPIRAIADGTVVFADPYKGYGRVVVVRHTGNMTSHYGHCNDIKARPGQRVKAGQILATVGSTGISTGPHLHFELRIDGVIQDPQKFIPGLEVRAAG